MLFRVSQLSPAIELIFDNTDEFINVYPSYHQKGGLVYQNVNNADWIVAGSQYRWETTFTDINEDTIPVIQLIYSYNATVADKQQQYDSFKAITAVETVTGKLYLYARTKPAGNFRIRYRILNKLDLAIPLNKLFAVGLGYTSEYDQLTAFLSALNPVSGQTMSLATNVPTAGLNQSGVMPGNLLARILKLENAYDSTLSQPYRISGYTSENASTQVTTYYQNPQDIETNTWYGECEFYTQSDVTDFTTADYLFYQQHATGLDLTHIYTGNVTTFKYALAANGTLKTIKGLQLLDTHNAIDISYMFADDTELQEVDLGSTCLSQVEHIEGLFKNCTSLQMIDVRSLDFTHLVDSGLGLIEQPDIFTGVPDDCTIWVSGSIQRDAILSVYPNLTGITYN